MNKTFGLIGYPLGHSFSPKIHNLLGDYEYRLFPLQEEEVGHFLRCGEFQGLNVTIPYKKTVMGYCAELSDVARRIGCVNTLLRREDGSLYGHNTDYEGLVYALRRAELTLAWEKVLVLGSGGSSLTARVVAQDMGAESVVVISRTGEDNYENLYRHRDAGIIINASPVGMYPDNGRSLVNLEDFPKCKGVCDLVYNPAYTKLLLDARGLGIPHVGGLPMLVAQAVAASELFQGKRLERSVIEKILQRIAQETKNILIIGMPGSGKTTIGRVLAEKLNRPFVDTDQMIFEEEGRSIPEIFAQDGEEAFRALEHRALERVSKESGVVISVGGGAVAREENHDLVRQNSQVIFLERELAQLETMGRPLSKKKSLEQIYEERIGLYQVLSQYTVENQVVEQTAEDIIKRLKLRRSADQRM